MFYSPKFRDVICVEQEPVGAFTTDHFYLACYEPGTQLISADPSGHGAVSLCRYGTNESSGYNLVINGPQPDHTLGIAQSRRMAHQLVAPS